MCLVSKPLPNSMAACGCGKPVMHVATKGRHTSPTAFEVKAHRAECCRCGRRTADFPTLAQALDEWNAGKTVKVLPMQRRA